ncbi:MAG TPA: triose-phosphate isomerase [Clostridia bacterium]|nr:triose-phosphate isomerase [Clostridia bacterium]
MGTNWKMNKNFAQAQEYVDELINLVSTHRQFSYFIIPPYTHLNDIKQQLKNSDIMLGAQNMHWATQGAYTGEISPRWLSDVGVNIALLGHSERRQYYNENDAHLNKKVHSALEYGMTALLCVGEYQEDKKFGVTSEVIRRQIKIGLFNIEPQNLEKVWVAYEPVWAIGEKGTPADPDYVEGVHLVIREQLLELFGNAGEKVSILYGGSVNVENCVSLSKRKNVDGLFIGRSAWDILTFKKIVELLLKADVGTSNKAGRSLYE